MTQRSTIMFDTRVHPSTRAELEALGWPGDLLRPIVNKCRVPFLSEHFHYSDYVHWTQAHLRLSGSRYCSGFRKLAFAYCGQSSRVLSPSPLHGRAAVVTVLRLDGFRAALGSFFQYSGHILVYAADIDSQAAEDKLVECVSDRLADALREPQTIEHVDFPRTEDRKGYR